MKVEVPSLLVRGEQLGVQAALFNHWGQHLEVVWPFWVAIWQWKTL